MEDYHTAFLRCVKDVEVLHEQKRRIAAMHFGGVAIECFLKYMIFTSLPRNAIKNWYDGTEETGNYGHTYKNPGHNYDAALGCLNTVNDRVKRFGTVQAWLNTVERPEGHFIDMRYLGYEPEEEKYKKWYHSYLSLKEWLQTKGMELLNRRR